MYFFLFASIFVLLVFSYYIFEKDILQPSVFLMLFFFVGIIVSFYLYNYWHLYEYQPVTVRIILLGLFSFIIGSIIAKHNKTKYVVIHKNDASAASSGRLNINVLVVIVVTLISLLTLFLFMQYYRTRTISRDIIKNILEYKGSVEDTAMPGYLNFLVKTICAFSNVNMIVLINNILNKDYRWKDLFLSAPILIYCLISILSANRGNILILILAGFSAWYILYHRIRGWDKRITWMVLSKGTKIASVVFILFWVFMVVVRNADLSNIGNSFMTYICSYFAGPFAGLNMYIRQGGGINPKWWGEETFVALNNNLNTLFETGRFSTRWLEFRSGYGFSVVNIYSSYRRFYHDFGYWGVSILSVIQGYITSRLYYIVKRKNTKGVDLALVIYCFFFYTIPYTLTDELFYSSNMSISGLAKLVILILAYFSILFGHTISRKRVGY